MGWLAIGILMRLVLKVLLEIFGYLEGFAMMCWWCLVNLDAYIEESRIYGAVLDREP